VIRPALPLYPEALLPAIPSSRPQRPVPGPNLLPSWKQGRNRILRHERKFGESLNARKFQAQIKELKIKLILNNISKIILAIFFQIYY